MLSKESKKAVNQIALSLTIVAMAIIMLTIAIRITQPVPENWRLDRNAKAQGKWLVRVSHDLMDARERITALEKALDSAEISIPLDPSHGDWTRATPSPPPPTL